MTAHSEAVRRLNDAFRRRGPAAGTWLVTAGVGALGSDFTRGVIQGVSAFASFNDANDLHGEHDFGTLEIAGHKLFWKIDYYDLDLEFGSENPADEAITRRVITIMLASEY